MRFTRSSQQSRADVHTLWRRFGRWTAALGIAAALSALPFAASAAPRNSAPPAAPLEQVQALVQPAVVYEQITWTGYVYDETNDGYFTTDPFTASFQCTGFVVNPDGYVATAGHCVDYDQDVRDSILSQVVDWAYANDYYEATPDRSTIATFAKNWRIDGATNQGTADLAVDVAYGVSVSGEPSGKALPARVVSLRPVGQGDVALLQIEAKDLTVASLSDNASTGVGTEVVAVGYPASVDLVTDVDFNPSFKEGTVSAEKTTDKGLLKVYEISAAVSSGMSGGPTVGLNGDVIGVNSFKISGETQPFNFVQPSQTLQELLRGEGIDNTLGTVTEKYRAGLEAYFRGDRDAAIKDFEEVLQVVPSHQFAQEYLSEAQALPASSSSPLIWIALGIGSVIVLVLLGFAVWAAKRKRAAVPGEASVYLPPTSGSMDRGSPVEEPLSRTPPQPEAPLGVPASDGASAGTEPEAATPDEVAIEDDESFCSNCGKQHDLDAHFCPHCGHPV